MGAPETWLSIDGDATRLLQENPVELAVGLTTLGFRHDPPTPLEIENAIAAVEDEIARVHERVAKGGRLHTRDAWLREIAHDAGVPPGGDMGLDAVEHAFNRIPFRAMGKEKAAALLILRELMHHLGYSAINIQE